MTSWRFEVSATAEDDLERLGDPVKIRVLEKIKWLRDNFEQLRHAPLGGKWEGFFKLRVGGWRIVYETEHQKRLVIIHGIDRRDKIYKRR